MVGMKSKVVAILETRTGAHLAELIARRGGEPLLAPALEEVPDVGPAAIRSLVDRWRARPFAMCIFQTGVGTRAMFSAADVAGLTSQLQALLKDCQVLVRGPKPVGELNARNIRIDIRAASPFTTETVLAALAQVDVNGAAILVQRYGDTNRVLLSELTARGAAVEEFATYRWVLPADTQPLVRLLRALQERKVDAVVFTSAAQVHNLHSIAEQTGSAAEFTTNLNRSLIASIGPVCSRALRQYGVFPALEADPPKLGPLIAALDAALARG